MANMELAGALCSKVTAKAILVRWGTKENWIPLCAVVQIPSTWRINHAKDRAGTTLIVADWVVKSKWQIDAPTEQETPDTEKAALLEQIKVLTEALNLETARFKSSQGEVKSLRHQVDTLSTALLQQTQENRRQQQRPPLRGVAAEILLKQSEAQPVAASQQVEQNRFNILELD